MRSRNLGITATFVLLALSHLAGDLFAAEQAPPKSDVAKWYAEDPSRLPKCKVDPRIEQAYPDIHATLAALKYALANDAGWQGVTWKQDEDLAAVRKGEIEALDDSNMMLGWKGDQKPLKEIRKGASFNDAVTQSATLVDFHVHTFLTGNDTDPIGPRPAAEVMRTISHELAHVWDHRVHTITKHSVDLGGLGLCYDFQKLVPDGPFAPESIGEIRRLMSSAGGDDSADKNTPDPDNTDLQENPNKVYIYAIDTSGLSLWVGTPVEAGKLTRIRELPDSGLDGSKVAVDKLLDKPFDTKNDAIAYLQQHVTTGHESHWTGTWVKYKGKEYRNVHVTEVVPAAK